MREICMSWFDESTDHPPHAGHQAAFVVLVIFVAALI
jgi:hypothetical protein